MTYTVKRKYIYMIEGLLRAGGDPIIVMFTFGGEVGSWIRLGKTFFYGGVGLPWMVTRVSSPVSCVFPPLWFGAELCQSDRILRSWLLR